MISEARPLRLGALHYGWIVLGTSMLVVLGAIGLARHGYTVLLPAMKDSLGLTYTETGLIATGNFVGYLTFAAVGGAIAARYNTRFVVTFGMLLGGSCLLATSLVTAFPAALVVRFLTGVASGLSNVPVLGLLAAWFGPRRRGMATGLAVGGSGLGIFLNGALVPWIMARWDWRVAWQVLGAAMLAIGVLALLLLRNRPGEMGLQPIGGAAAAAPSSTTAPWRRVVYSRALWHLAAVYFLCGFSYIIYVTYFATHLIKDAGFTSAAAGRVWAVTGGLSIGSACLWGLLSDRWGRRPALITVYVLQAACFLLFPAQNSVPALITSAVLYGLVAGSPTVIIASAAADYLGPRLAPAGVGMVTMIFSIGQALGPSVAGALADATDSFSSAFVLAACMSAVGAGVAALLPRVRKE